MILSEKNDIYISSCSDDGGIYHLKSDGKGNVEIKNIYSVKKPMYLIEDNNKLYCIVRAAFKDNNFSGIISYDILSDGSLCNPSLPVSTKGEVACHICKSGDDIYCANYISGSVIKLGGALDIHSGKGVNEKRQEKPHTHFVCESPDKKYIFATDLGTDEIYVYDKDLNVVSATKMPDGTGPRHLALHSDGKHIFCANEISSTLSLLEYSSGKLTYKYSIELILQEDKDNNTAAAIRCEDSKIYISHRGLDCISEVDFDGENLTLNKNIPVCGKSPRDLWVDEEVYICTNQDSDNVTFISRESEKPIFEFEMKCPISVISVKSSENK